MKKEVNVEKLIKIQITGTIVHVTMEEGKNG